MSWETIDDNKVRHIWVHEKDNIYPCTEDDKMTIVSPYSYTDIGLPICSECGIDLAYDHTEVLTS